MLTLILTTGETKEEIAVLLELLITLHANAGAVAVEPLLTGTCTKQRFVHTNVISWQQTQHVSFDDEVGGGFFFGGIRVASPYVSSFT